MYLRVVEEIWIFVLKNIWYISKWRVKMFSCKRIKEFYDSFIVIMWRYYKISFYFDLWNMIYMCILRMEEVVYCRLFVFLLYL